MNKQQQAALQDLRENKRRIEELLKELAKLNEQQNWLMEIITAEQEEAA